MADDYCGWSAGLYKVGKKPNETSFTLLGTFEFLKDPAIEFEIMVRRTQEIKRIKLKLE